MGLAVEVEEGEEEDQWIAVVADDEYPYLRISFEYSFTEAQLSSTEGHLFRSGFSVRWDSEGGASRFDDISLYEIRRDFPIGVWERAAQAAVVAQIEVRLEEDEYGETVQPTPSSEKGLPRLL